METFDTQEAEMEIILRYIQHRISRKYFAGEDVLSLLPSADVASCLHKLEKMEGPASSSHLYH